MRPMSPTTVNEHWKPVILYSYNIELIVWAALLVVFCSSVPGRFRLPHLLLAPYHPEQQQRHQRHRLNHHSVRLDCKCSLYFSMGKYVILPFTTLEKTDLRTLLCALFLSPSMPFSPRDTADTTLSGELRPSLFRSNITEMIWRA